MLDKETLSKSIINRLEKNYPEVERYFDFELDIFTEFNTLIYEINKCLLLDLDRAVITLTNNLLERLLKLALIHNEAGIGPISIEKWDETFEEPNQKYSSFKLGNSIEKCLKLKLITPEEKKVLFDNIRENFRNGFSHADPSKYLSELPKSSKIYSGKLDNKGTLTEHSINPKINPVFQAIYTEQYAKNNSFPFYKFVFDLIFKIESRLKVLHTTPH